jgi:hypothetical protein
MIAKRQIDKYIKSLTLAQVRRIARESAGSVAELGLTGLAARGHRYRLVRAHVFSAVPGITT